MEISNRFDTGAIAEMHSLSIATISGVSGGLVTIACLENLTRENSSPYWTVFQYLATAAASVSLYSASLKFSGSWKFSGKSRESSPAATSATESDRVEASDESDDVEELPWTASSILLGFKQAILDLQSWFHALSFLTLSFPLFSFTTFFLPRIISRLSTHTGTSLPASVPMAVFSTLTTITMYHLVSRSKSRRVPLILISNYVALFGYLCLFFDFPFHYISITLVPSFLYPSAALVFTWPAQSLPGSRTKRAASGAIQVFLGGIGGAAGITAYKARPMWELENGHLWAAAFLAGGIGIICSISLILGPEQGSEHGTPVLVRTPTQQQQVVREVVEEFEEKNPKAFDS